MLVVVLKPPWKSIQYICGTADAVHVDVVALERLYKSLRHAIALRRVGGRVADGKAEHGAAAIELQAYRQSSHEARAGKAV